MCKARPRVHTERVTNGQVKDSFPGHNLASLAIFEQAGQALQFNEADRQQMAWLVKNHDLFINFEINRVNLQNLIQTIPDGVNPGLAMRNLVMVGRADNLAQNPDLTKASLQKIDTFSHAMSAVLYGVHDEFTK